MDAEKLEYILTCLSLDAEARDIRDGFSGYAVLEAEGRMIYARPQTVVVKGNHNVSSKPGLGYVVLEPDGSDARDFLGRKQFPGMMQDTFQGFVEKFGHLFAASKIALDLPEDPFAALMAKAC